MTEDEKKETAEGVKAADRIAEEAETSVRSVTGRTQWIIPVIAASWSLFQLALPSVIILNTVYIQAIHLGFAITLVYLTYPLFKRSRKGEVLGYLSARARFTTVDYILMATLTVPIIVTLGAVAGLVVPLIAAHLFVTLLQPRSGSLTMATAQ